MASVNRVRAAVGEKIFDNKKRLNVIIKPRNARTIHFKIRLVFLPYEDACTPTISDAAQKCNIYSNANSVYEVWGCFQEQNKKNENVSKKGVMKITK